jgi:hypothetical protein
MNKFAEAYPGNESKGKHRYAVVYCGNSAYGEKRSRDVEISYFIDCVDDADKNPEILKDIITSNIRAFNCTGATLFMVFSTKRRSSYR